MFGPAITSGIWDDFHLYLLGELLGAIAGGLIVNNLHRFGLVLGVNRRERSSSKPLTNLDKK